MGGENRNDGFITAPMLMRSRFDIRRIEKILHHVILPALLTCYVVTGLQGSQVSVRSLQPHHVNSHSASQDRGTRGVDDNRPYWTNHKHRPSKHGACILDVALVGNIPVEHAPAQILTSPFREPSLLLTGLSDFHTSRAPPALSPQD